MKRRDLCFWLSAISLMGVLAGCEDTSSGVTGYILKCTPGEVKCEAGQLLTCVGTSWYPIDCPSNECLEDGTNCKLLDGQICTPDQQMCSNDGTSILTCDPDGKNFQAKPCTEGKCNMSAGKVECSDADNILECNATDVKCSNDLKSTMTCNSENKWGKEIACPEATPVCDPVQKKCVEATSTNDCNDGDVKCSDDHKGIISCTPEHAWGTAVACPVDKPVCDDELKQCVEATSTDECNDEDVKCSDDLRGIISCTPEHTWGTAVACPEATPVCDPEQKKCVETTVTDDCNDGDVKCSEDLREIISCTPEHTWGTAVACPEATPVCDPVQKKCVETTVTDDCNDGDVKCSEDHQSVLRCLDKAWDEQPCPEDYLCLDESLKCVPESIHECNPDEIKCMNESQFITCKSDETWDNELKTCPKSKPYCDNKTNECLSAPPACDEGISYCSPDLNYVFLCEGGKIVVKDDCLSQKKVCDPISSTCEEEPVLVCNPDEIFCKDRADGSGTDAYICDSQGLNSKLLQECDPENEYCLHGKGCVPKSFECEPKDRKCFDNYSYVVCGEYGWGLPNYCSKSEICEDGQCVSVISHCTEDDNYCENDNEIWTCKDDGSFVLEKCPDERPLCDKYLGQCVETVTECKPGEAYCDANKYVSCNDGHWTSQICTETETCYPTIGCIGTAPVCNPNDAYCKENVLYLCNELGTGWNNVKCTESQKCNEKLKTCVDIVVSCTDNENYCKDNVYVYCQGGDWQEIYCKSGYECLQDKGCVKPSVLCDESESHCKPEDNVLAECIKGEWYYTYCGEKGLVCDPKLLSCVESMTECKSGTIQCSEDLSTLMMCEGGIWKYDYCKDYGLMCDPERLICTGGTEVCKEGARKCADSGTSMVCKDNVWYKEPCNSNQVCNVETGYCENIFFECKDGDRECLPDYSGYIYCKGGTWVKRDCKDGLICDPKTVTCLEKPIECKDGERYCYDSSTIKYCKGGTWYYTKCEEGYCDKDTAQCVTSTECKDGEQYCADSETLVVCQDGHWKKTLCPESSYCDKMSGQCVSIFDCSEGEKYCSSSTTLMYCKEGKWVEQECSKSQYCDIDTATCVNYHTECTEGDFYCNDASTLVRCEDGRWKTTLCSKSQYCSNELGVCVDYATDCTPGDVQCYDDFNLKICGKDSKWYISACSSSTPYCYVGMNKCVECIPGDSKCKDDMTALSCSRSGTWIANYCAENQICNAGVCEDILAECYDGEGYCKDYSTSVYCVEGKWVTTYCPKSEYCEKESGLCVPATTECEGDAIKCADDGNYRYACKDGRWVIYDYCSKTQVCMDNECVDVASPECMKGERKCNGYQIYYCNVDNNWVLDKEHECTRSQYCNDKVGSVCIPNKAICTEPSYSCIGNTTNKCLQGLYDPYMNCEKGYCSISDTGSAFCLESCTPDSTFCSPDYSQILSCNSLGLGTTLVEDCGKMRCVENDEGKPTCEKHICTENELSCGTEDPNIVYSCQNNKLVELVNCKDYGLSCKEGKCLY